MGTYINNYVMVAIFVALGIILPVAAISVVGRILRPHRPTSLKGETYESGNRPFMESRIRYNARYYLFCPHVHRVRRGSGLSLPVGRRLQQARPFLR